MHRLLQEVEEEKSRLAAAQYVCRHRADIRMQRVYDIESQMEEDASKIAGPSRDRSMWVDKYRPKRFADLLGEDVGGDEAYLTPACSPRGARLAERMGQMCVQTGDDNEEESKDRRGWL